MGFNLEIYDNFPHPRRMVMQRNASTEKFQAVVGKVKLANRVVRRLQFHTTRTVARAIDGPDSAPKRVGF